jgi:hypothetical protein
MAGLLDFGYRPSGEKKERGYLGILQNPQGNAMTEYSVDYGFGDIPSLIPTLMPAELNYILQTGIVPQSIDVKLIQHALMRQRLGLSPFWNQQQDNQQP